MTTRLTHVTRLYPIYNQASAHYLMDPFYLKPMPLEAGDLTEESPYTSPYHPGGLIPLADTPLAVGDRLSRTMFQVSDLFIRIDAAAGGNESQPHVFQFQSQLRFPEQYVSSFGMEVDDGHEWSHQMELPYTVTIGSNQSTLAGEYPFKDEELPGPFVTAEDGTRYMQLKAYVRYDVDTQDQTVHVHITALHAVSHDSGIEEPFEYGEVVGYTLIAVYSE